MTFRVNKNRNHAKGSTGRIRLVTMLSLVFVAKLGAALVTGATEVPGGLRQHSTQVTVETSSSGLPIVAGRDAMTPLGALWLRMINWLDNWIAPDGVQEDEAANRVRHYSSDEPT